MKETILTTCLGKDTESMNWKRKPIHKLDFINIKNVSSRYTIWWTQDCACVKAHRSIHHREYSSMCAKKLNRVSGISRRNTTKTTDFNCVRSVTSTHWRDRKKGADLSISGKWSLTGRQKMRRTTHKHCPLLGNFVSCGDGTWVNNSETAFCAHWGWAGQIRKWGGRLGGTVG